MIFALEPQPLARSILHFSRSVSLSLFLSVSLSSLLFSLDRDRDREPRFPLLCRIYVYGHVL